MQTESVDILLVEDNPRDVELTLRALRKTNVANHITTVGDGAEALDFVFARGAFADRDRRDHPRVIFLDLKLPKIDGIEVLRQIKSNEETRTIPVVVITSSAEERDRVRSYQFGVNSFVVKPIDFEAFAAVIADLGFYWLAVNRPLS